MSEAKEFRMKYFIVQGRGQAFSMCPGENKQLVPAVREGSVFAADSQEAIEIYKYNHDGYFIPGTDSWQARPMTNDELVKWEKDGIFPTYDRRD